MMQHGHEAARVRAPVRHSSSHETHQIGGWRQVQCVVVGSTRTPNPRGSQPSNTANRPSLEGHLTRGPSTVLGCSPVLSKQT
jgi:hypothetical protein